MRLFCSDGYRLVRPETPKSVSNESSSKLIARFRYCNFLEELRYEQENIKISDSKPVRCPTGPKSDHGASTTPPTSLLESERAVEQLFRARRASSGILERLKGLNRHESVKKRHRRSSCVEWVRFGIQKNQL